MINRALTVNNIAIFLWVMLSGCSADKNSNKSLSVPSNNPLPNWLSEEEKSLSDNESVSENLNEPMPELPEGFRIPAEYEPMEALLLSYRGYNKFLTDIAKVVSNAGTPIWMVKGPNSLPGVDSSKYKPINLPVDTVWSRDYGPVAINSDTGERIFIDFKYRHHASRRNDDRLPTALANNLNEKAIAVPLILDGGNLMSDRRGHLYFTERMYDWNKGKSRAEVDRILLDSLKAKKVHAFEYAKSGSQPLDGTGHLDMFAKIVSDCDVLVVKTEARTYKQVTDKAANYFANQDCGSGSGTKWRVHRVPGFVNGRAWNTYTNSIIINNVVVVPSYSSKNHDAVRSTYQKAMPNHKIEFVNSDQPIRAGGAIHCTTREIPSAGF